MQTIKLIKQSEFKKPYLEDDYNTMEYTYLPPGWPEFPPGPGEGVIPDCKPKGDGLGGSNDDLCDTSKGCGKWCWSCGHKITSFSVTQNHCWIQSGENLEGDVVCVVFCCDRERRDNIRGTGLQ